jgi:4'-phosphopantetheinyl transferase EntD
MSGAGRSGEVDLTPLREALRPYGVLVAARRILPGDEAAFADPGPASAPGRLQRRHAGGAARIAARALLGELGADPLAPLRRRASGAPEWPEGILGSLAHDDHFAVAAVARRGRLAGLGIDVEPPEPLPDDVVGFALSDAERRATAGDRTSQRLVFAAKEAVYKAIHPLDGSPLEYADIEIRLAEGIATLADGRSLTLVTMIGERLIAAALAFAPA